jgi:hypothetical protein
MRDVFRRKGITHADVAAPPTEAECEAQDIDFYKGVDDMLGAGNNLGDLVIDRYEAPHEAIRNAVEANCSRQRRKWAIWAIEDLSLNVYCPERERKPRGKHGEWRGGFLTMRGLLGQERSDRAARLVRAIQWCFTIEEGSTETEKRKVPYEEIIVTTWKDNKPLRLTLKEEYRAHEERDRLKVADFWQRATVQGLLDDVDDLKRRVVGIENAA